MRCKSCRYSLANLTEHRCPECGREFDPSDPSTYEVPYRTMSLRAVLWIAVVCFLVNLCFTTWVALKETPGDLGSLRTAPLGALFLLPFTFVPGVVIYAIVWIIRKLLARPAA